MCWLLSQPLDEQNMVSVHGVPIVQEGRLDLANRKQVINCFLISPFLFSHLGCTLLESRLCLI